jgi:hypothetical protein
MDKHRHWQIDKSGDIKRPSLLDIFTLEQQKGSQRWKSKLGHFKPFLNGFDNFVFCLDGSFTL